MFTDNEGALPSPQNLLALNDAGNAGRDNDSIMGMNAKNELVEGDKGSGLEGKGGSMVSDEDYYRQDYFMLGLSAGPEEEEAQAEPGDPDIRSLSERILDEMNDFERSGNPGGDGDGGG